jgi:ribosomal protein L11 methyltransferase
MQQTSDLDSTILRLPEQLKGCVAQLAGHYCPSQNCGCSSVGRAPPCQGGRREFEPRHPLQPRKLSGLERVRRSFSEDGPPKPCKLEPSPVYLWRKRAELHWVKAKESLLQARDCGQLVIVSRPACKRLELEIVCRSRSDSSALLKKFGGRIEALPRNWLERFARAESKAIKIGKRLIISSAGGPLVSRLSRHKGRSHIIIPASLAFGTGEHATTAMSLRLLEQLTRCWNPGWSLADLGTGSGILALAAKCFGAGQVVGIDNDPAAISVAKSNARLNKIRGATFQLSDVHKWNPAQKADVTTANLYSDLLIEILPKLRGGGWLILSGILRSQQNAVVRALQRNKLDVIKMKHRGKWVAILAAGAVCSRRTSRGKFLRRP